MYKRQPLPYDAVIVDEMSMVDIEIFASLMQALRLGSKLIMVDVYKRQTQGRGNYTMEPHSYVEVPKNIADKIISERTKNN